MTQDLKHHWENLVTESIQYGKLRLEYAKLKAGEEAAKAGGKLSGAFMLLLMFGVAVFLSSIAAAIYLGEALESYSLGFLIVSGVYLFLALLAMVFRKPLIERPATNLIIRSVFDNEDEEA